MLQFKTDQIADLAVTTAKINDLAVTTGKLAANAVTAAKAKLDEVWAFTALPTCNQTPVSADDLVRKSYVDGLAAGMDPKQSCRVATTGVLQNSPTYANGVAGNGATLTAGSNGSINSAGIDGVTDLAVGDRILVKDQAAGLQNGIYTVTVVGSGGSAYVLTRALDMDGGGVGGEVSSGNITYIEEGTVNGTTIWMVTTTGFITMGTDSIDWSQFSGPGTVTAGDGIHVTGSQVFVDLVAAGGLEFSGGDIQVKRDDTGGSNLATVINRSTNGLAVRVDDVTIEGSAASSTGQLRVKADSIALSHVAFRPEHEQFTGNDGAATYALAHIVDSDFYDAVIVFRQGQRLKQVASAPADLSEYSVAFSSGATRVTLGANLPTGEVMIVDYLY